MAIRPATIGLDANSSNVRRYYVFLDEVAQQRRHKGLLVALWIIHMRVIVVCRGQPSTFAVPLDPANPPLQSRLRKRSLSDTHQRLSQNGESTLGTVF